MASTPSEDYFFYVNDFKILGTLLPLVSRRVCASTGGVLQMGEGRAAAGALCLPLRWLSPGLALERCLSCLQCSPPPRRPLQPKRGGLGPVCTWFCLARCFTFCFFGAGCRSCFQCCNGRVKLHPPAFLDTNLILEL